MGQGNNPVIRLPSRKARGYADKQGNGVGDGATDALDLAEMRSLFDFVRQRTPKHINLT